MRTIDVISDVICPWCWIGRANLMAALEELRAEGLRFRIRWLPFQLNPDMPLQGVARDEYRARKFGSLERSRELDAQVAEVGRDAGLDFRFDLIARTPNSLAAHRVIRAADLAQDADDAPEDLQERVVEALFDAYFRGGRDLGDIATLDAIAASAGLPGMGEMLTRSDHRFEVLEEDQSFRNAGVAGVPTFLMDRHLLFSGAQPGAEMARAFREAHGVLSARERRR
ncbi:DsbA family oxidoreductase [Falsiroseomonas oryziterrae]|uniref:DsbA family oxidoreductase n=1 Tax=Falsiroseomonas oryziterrae TaxID=2911368 RepID=UPI001F245DEF|nr:DsbA family oxidoreductase [Roseomonas sp. NPKOSM-4]